VRNIKWWVIVPVGAGVWLVLFLQWPLESIVLLVAVGGWWDYMRRRAKLHPPPD
jgi:hypothetical protein